MGNDKKQEDKKEDQTPARSSSSPPPPSSETSRIQNLIRKFTILKSTGSNDVSTSASNSNLEGGRIRPIGCTLTKSLRLDITVKKSTEILHHSDWTKSRNIGQFSKSGVGREQED